MFSKLWLHLLLSRWPSQCHARSHHWETAVLRPPVRVRGTSYRHTSVWCSPPTLLAVILKHFYFTSPFIMALLGALVVLLHLRRRNLDFLHTYIHYTYTHEVWLFSIGLLLQSIWTVPRYLKPKVGACVLQYKMIEMAVVTTLWDFRGWMPFQPSNQQCRSSRVLCQILDSLKIFFV